MKKHTFTVTIEFEDKICSDDEINEIAKNIGFGLMDMANGMGLAPDASETFTKEISVHSPITNVCVWYQP